MSDDLPLPWLHCSCTRAQGTHPAPRARLAPATGAAARQRGGLPRSAGGGGRGTGGGTRVRTTAARAAGVRKRDWGGNGAIGPCAGYGSGCVCNGACGGGCSGGCRRCRGGGGGRRSVGGGVLVVGTAAAAAGAASLGGSGERGERDGAPAAHQHLSHGGEAWAWCGRGRGGVAAWAWWGACWLSPAFVIGK